MIGGGGSGSTERDYGYCGGGHAGGIVSQDVAVNYGGGTVSVVVGAGGLAPAIPINSNSNGNAGGASKFGTVTASGGAGGIVSFTNLYPTYNGNGGARTTCGGTFYDGTYNYTHGSIIGWGGQAGFANGGNGTRGANAGNGGVGAGGGAASDHINLVRAGNGGRGEVRISWSD